MRAMTATALGTVLCMLTGCTMTEHKVDQLTRQWILVWNNGDPTTLPLAEDFKHTSPYGVIEGREHYLETVIPMAKQNAAKLAVEDVLVRGEQSVIRYKVVDPAGETMPACDWLRFKDGQLSEVRAFYERPVANRSTSY